MLKNASMNNARGPVVLIPNYSSKKEHIYAHTIAFWPDPLLAPM